MEGNKGNRSHLTVTRLLLMHLTLFQQMKVTLTTLGNHPHRHEDPQCGDFIRVVHIFPKYANVLLTESKQGVSWKELKAAEQHPPTCTLVKCESDLYAIQSVVSELILRRQLFSQDENVSLASSSYVLDLEARNEEDH